MSFLIHMHSLLILIDLCNLKVRMQSISLIPVLTIAKKNVAKKSCNYLNLSHNNQKKMNL